MLPEDSQSDAYCFVVAIWVKWGRQGLIEIKDKWPRKSLNGLIGYWTSYTFTPCNIDCHVLILPWTVILTILSGLHSRLQEILYQTAATTIENTYRLVRHDFFRAYQPLAPGSISPPCYLHCFYKLEICPLQGSSYFPQACHYTVGQCPLTH